LKKGIARRNIPESHGEGRELAIVIRRRVKPCRGDVVHVVGGASLNARRGPAFGIHEDRGRIKAEGRADGRVCKGEKDEKTMSLGTAESV